MTTTGHGACWLTWWLTEPRTNPAPPTPRSRRPRHRHLGGVKDGYGGTGVDHDVLGWRGQSGRVDLGGRPDERVAGGLFDIGEERRCGVVEGVEHRRAEAVHDGERRLAGSGFSDGPRKGPDQGVRAVDAHDDSSGSVVRTMFLITDHGDGTDSVVQAMQADRPDEQPAEPAQPAVALTTNRSAPADAATRQLPAGRTRRCVRP